MVVAAVPVSGGSSSHPDVSDDQMIDDHGLPDDINVLDGWVDNETATAFSLFMRVASLAPPPAGSVDYYHFHFQVLRTDGNTSLYHGMVHHSETGAWTWMVQRWISSGGVGAWGDTHGTSGAADAAAGTVEVVVEKAWVESPKVDIAKSTWTIDSFYIHADRANVSSGALQMTDHAPSVGTMGSYAVSTGTPVGARPSPGLPAGAAIVAVLAAVLVATALARRRGRGDGV